MPMFAPRPLHPRIVAAAAGIVCAALGLHAGPAAAVDFDVIALSGTTALPFSSGLSTAYTFNLRAPTLADDGWVGFAPAQSGLLAGSFMLGQPGDVRHVVSVGDSFDGSAVTTLRAMRVDSGQRVALTASQGGSSFRHYVSDGLGIDPLARLAASGIVYNRISGTTGAIGFELLPGGQQLVHAANAAGSTYEAGRLSDAGSYVAAVQSNLAASRSLPTTAVPGVGTPAAGRSFATVANLQAVGGDASGRSYFHGAQSTAMSIDGASVSSNLIELRPDGTRVSIVHPGSMVPGVAQPSQGINATLAQFASGANGTLAFRNDFGRQLTTERKLQGALLRYTPGATVADSTLSVVALPGATVPGLVSSINGAVNFGHKVGVDSSTLAPLSMLPDNLVLDAARGLAVNADGDIAFVSAITAAPAAAGYGVFLSRADGSFATLASSSTITAGQAPGTDTTFAKFHDVTLNDAGLVVFSATLNGADARQGLWFGSGAADMQLLAVEGQAIEILPGVFKTIGNLDTGLHDLADRNITALDDGLNNQGQFAFSVIFTDGTQAVLRTDLVSAVPEPGNWALLLVGLTVVAGAARRRRMR